MATKLPLKILFVEDEPKLRERACIILNMKFAEVFPAENGEEGLKIVAREHPDIVISDIKMPVMDGLEMVRLIREANKEIPVILCTAFTETTYLLKAIELGVTAYLRKPLDGQQLIDTITRTAAPILQRIELEETKRRERASLELLLGESPAMQDVIQKSQRIAGTDFSLLIQGETGAGKSHLAAVIHRMSLRRHSPFISVTMGALPETLLESQLFGHLKGSFTDASATKKGLFEEADGGTIFLDDIDCAPLNIQAKILHAVEEKRFFPVGGTKPVQVNIRIIAASNKDLQTEVSKGNFRQDLYFRLSELVITLPSLRERGNDIALLARLFLNNVSLELDRIPPRFTNEALYKLNRHPWPGNVRELRNKIKRAALFAHEEVTAEIIDSIMSSGTNAAAKSESPVAMQTFEEIKCQAIRQALAASGGKKMEAARMLDMDYSSFKRMLEKYNL